MCMCTRIEQSPTVKLNPMLVVDTVADARTSDKVQRNVFAGLSENMSMQNEVVPQILPCYETAAMMRHIITSLVIVPHPSEAEIVIAGKKTGRISVWNTNSGLQLVAGNIFGKLGIGTITVCKLMLALKSIFDKSLFSL